jgi:hypothetical protein
MSTVNVKPFGRMIAGEIWLGSTLTVPGVCSRPLVRRSLWCEAFRGFLAGFERQLPLRQASRITTSRAMVSAIMSATGGITGHISKLLSRAAEAAICAKKECITPELLQSVINARI